MKTALLALALLALVPSGPALAHGHRVMGPTLSASCCDPPARWAPRHALDDARLAITTESGGATLLLTREVVAIQLSDRMYHRVCRELKNKEDDDDDGFLGEIIRSAVLRAVREVLNHSAECSIRDVADMAYANGELVITTAEGDRLFEDVDVDDTDVMRDFTEADARAFVREFHRLKSRGGF
jgi:hypothetical protein